MSSRWSRSGDLLEALESLARNAAFGVAEKDGSLDRVEDELFRFGRILDREPELARLLSDSATPADKRVGLLREVLTDQTATASSTAIVDRLRSAVGDDDPPAWLARHEDAARADRAHPAQPQPRRGGRGALRARRGAVATATWPTSAPPSG